MPARCPGLQQERTQALRGSIDGCGEPSRASPDDDQVANLLLIDALVEAQPGGDLVVTWIAKDRFTAVDQNRDVRDRDMEAIKHGLRIWIGFEIEKRMGVAIACQKVANTQGSLGVQGAN